MMETLSKKSCHSKMKLLHGIETLLNFQFVCVQYSDF